jgi:hypothetical protein
MHRNKLSLLICATVLSTLSIGRPASAQVLQSGDVNLIGIGASLLNNILYPPYRGVEIQAEAEVRKAKIAAEMELERERMRIAAAQAADKVAPILDRWGVDRISCAPGLVFINGIDANTVCIQPTVAIAPGYYTYDRDRQILLRNSTTSQTTQVIRSTTILSTNRSGGNKGF